MAKKRGQNEGSIFRRRDGRWCGVLNLGRVAGRRARKHFYADTRQEVAVMLTKALREKDQGLPVSTDRQTIQQFIDYWLEHHVTGSVRPRTLESYRLLSRKHITPALGSYPLQQLSPQHVQALLNQKSKAGLAPQTVRHVRTVLRRALNFAMKWGLVARNVAALVDPPRVERHEIRPFTLDQAQRFLQAVKDERLGPLYAVTLLLGVRQGEALGLRWTDITELEGTDPALTVAQALQRINREFRFVSPKTERSRRRIALSRSAVKALLAQRRCQAIDRLAAGPGWEDFGLVFTMPDGSPIERKTLHRDFKRVLQGNDLPDVRFHDLRHSAASLLLAQGIHPRVVMELLGHSQISLTMDTYSHVMPNMVRAAVDSIDEALSAKS